MIHTASTRYNHFGNTSICSFIFLEIWLCIKTLVHSWCKATSWPSPMKPVIGNKVTTVSPQAKNKSAYLCKHAFLQPTSLIKMSVMSLCEPHRLFNLAVDGLVRCHVIFQTSSLCYCRICTAFLHLSDSSGPLLGERSDLVAHSKTTTARQRLRFLGFDWGQFRALRERCQTTQSF